MIEAKKLDKGKKDGDSVVRAKKYRFGLRCYNYLSGEESKSNKMTIGRKYGKMDENIKLIFKMSVISKLQNCFF